MNPVRRFKDGWYVYYSRADRRPSAIWQLAAGLLPEAQRIEILRRIRTLQLPMDPLESADPPAIELLLVAVSKDFPTLGLAASAAIRYSRNPISRVVVITPENEVSEAEELLAEMALPVSCQVLSEDDVLEAVARTILRERFGARYGWVLQQFLCLAYASASRAAGVLVLDSDTILVRERLFFDGQRQLLMPTLEHHEPYYLLLRRLSSLFPTETNSFVSHHMLWQPAVVQELLAIVCDGDFVRFAEMTASMAEMDTLSPVSLDYEFYAQGIAVLHPEKVKLAKWSNASAEGGDRPHLRERQLRNSHFASLSFHSNLY